MSTTKPSTVGEQGIDRRTLIKRSAVAGAIAWTAPTILASPAHASEFIPGTTCTLKCAPQPNSTVQGTALAIGCEPGVPPGQSGVVAQILTAEAADSSVCGCGGDPVVTVSDPAIGTEFVVRPKPGNLNEGEFDIEVTISCTDNSGDIITVTCTAVATAFVRPGNCNSVGGEEFGWTADVSCGAPQCVEAGEPA